MANEDFLNGTDVLLLIDTDTDLNTPLADVEIPGDFEAIACLTSNSWDATTSAIDTASKCSGRYTTSIPGDLSATASAEGFAVTDVDAATNSQVNHNRLAALQLAGTTFWLGFFDSALNTVRYGKAYLTSFSDAAPRQSAQTFSAQFQIVGEWATVVPTT